MLTLRCFVIVINIKVLSLICFLVFSFPYLHQHTTTSIDLHQSSWWLERSSKKYKTKNIMNMKKIIKNKNTKSYCQLHHQNFHPSTNKVKHTIEIPKTNHLFQYATFVSWWTSLPHPFEFHHGNNVFQIFTTMTLSIVIRKLKTILDVFSKYNVYLNWKLWLKHF